MSDFLTEEQANKEFAKYLITLHKELTVEQYDDYDYGDYDYRDDDYYD